MALSAISPHELTSFQTRGNYHMKQSVMDKAALAVGTPMFTLSEGREAADKGISIPQLRALKSPPSDSSERSLGSDCHPNQAT